MRYFVIPDSQDDCPVPTTPEPIELSEISLHVEMWLRRFDRQGYFSNCRQERLQLNEMSFTLIPEQVDELPTIEDAVGFLRFIGGDNPDE